MPSGSHPGPNPLAEANDRGNDGVMSGTGDRGSAFDVLVVDDEPDVASSTADILASAGLAVGVAGTVDDATSMLVAHDVRSVILDHHLVGEDGERFLTQVIDLPAVIVMSGLGRVVLGQLQENYGDRLFACLAKPVPPVTLIEVVRKALG
jgi:DNA-binding NtrC family response regulator